MKKKLMMVGVVMAAVCAWAEPTITDVKAQQRYPWNGKVDISYMVENAGTESLVLSVWAVDQTTGITNVAWHVTGDTAYTRGKHHIIWDMTADDCALVSTNVVFTVSYVEQEQPKGLYCVIDLSGGTLATSYPITYLDEVPLSGWSDEYKTSKLVLRRISAGIFTMGSPTGELKRSYEEVQHQVTLTKDFLIGVFEVTQRQWELVMGTRPSYFNNNACYMARPVEQVSYDMIRGASVGARWPKSPAVDASSFLGVIRDKTGLVLDLPTEAQWEYACRAGTLTALNSGKNLISSGQDPEMDKLGRYKYNGGAEASQSSKLNAGTAKVGSYAPNAWGLYDMHANVWEWCLDWQDEYSGDVTDPAGSPSGSMRKCRGGSYRIDAHACRSAYRGMGNPSKGNYAQGFRLVRTLSDIQGCVNHLQRCGVCNASSVPVRIDLSQGPRTAAATERITYSTDWERGAGDVVAVVSVNGEVISEQSGSGAVEWVPTKNGTYELSHKVMSGGGSVGETLTATFEVVLKPEPIDDCVAFSSESSFTLKTANTSKNWDGTLWTSMDKINWTEWEGAEVSAAQTGGTYYLYVRGNENNTRIAGYDSSYRWVLTGNDIACTGNIETLRGATGSNPSLKTMKAACYSGMFQGCTALKSAPALPATTLASSCYEYMFSGCTVLMTAPALPAITLAKSCYSGMFQGCTALVEAPALPATALAEYCYSGTFRDCTALVEAPALPAKTLAKSCYSGMFQGCTVLVEAPALPATALADYCYGDMFRNCTALTAAPTLSATALTDGCYGSMFYGCTALEVAPALPAMSLVTQCYANMFDGCTALKDAPTLPATMLAMQCYQAMFSGCTALKTPPALPATNLDLAYYCYRGMFSGCTSLTDVPALPATKLADYCYNGMFQGCTSLVVNTAAPGKEWKIPATSTSASYWGYNMFSGTKGSLQDQPALNTTYYINSALPEPIDPGGEIVVPEGKAEEKAAEINNNPAVKAQYLKAPGGIETTAQYRECFDAVATSGSTVAFVLNEEGTNQVVEATSAAKTNTLESVLSKTGTLVIGDPLIGFYYSLKQGSDVTVGDKADLNKLAGRDTLSFPLTTDKSKYFYQSLVTPTPVSTK